jgi:hypothetical protein
MERVKRIAQQLLPGGGPAKVGVAAIAAAAAPALGAPS